MSDMEKIQHDLQDLYREMRETNVRSHGLKVGTHETWCLRLDKILCRVRELQATDKTPPPPPPPPVSLQDD